MLSKNFDAKENEEKWYNHWMSKGYFKSLPDEREPYTIVIPATKCDRHFAYGPYAQQYNTRCIN